jgi:hypothetical protein
MIETVYISAKNIAYHISYNVLMNYYRDSYFVVLLLLLHSL